MFNPKTNKNIVIFAILDDFEPALLYPGLANPGFRESGLWRIRALPNPGFAESGLANPGLLNPGLGESGLAESGSWRIRA